MGFSLLRQTGHILLELKAAFMHGVQKTCPQMVDEGLSSAPKQMGHFFTGAAEELAFFSSGTVKTRLLERFGGLALRSKPVLDTDIVLAVLSGGLVTCEDGTTGCNFTAITSGSSSNSIIFVFGLFLGVRSESEIVKSMTSVFAWSPAMSVVIPGRELGPTF